MSETRYAESPAAPERQGVVLSVHEFGGAEPDGSPGELNLQLARVALELQRAIQPPPPIVGTQLIDAALRYASDGAVGVDHLIQGASSGAFGTGVGTWGEVQAVRQFMDQNGYAIDIAVAQRRHAWRVERQLYRGGVHDYDIAGNLPKGYPKNSPQRWTRGPVRFMLRELIGVPVLWLQRKI